jgi:hypothetical protein
MEAMVISVYLYNSEELASLLPDICVEPGEIRRIIVIGKR